MKKCTAAAALAPALAAMLVIATAAHGHEYLSCRKELLALNKVQMQVLELHEERPFRDVKNRKQLLAWIKTLARLAGNTARLASDYTQCAEGLPKPSGRNRGK